MLTLTTILQSCPVVSHVSFTAPLTPLKVFMYIAGQPWGQSHVTPSHTKLGSPAEKWQPAGAAKCGAATHTQAVRFQHCAAYQQGSFVSTSSHQPGCGSAGHLQAYWLQQKRYAKSCAKHNVPLWSTVGSCQDAATTSCWASHASWHAPAWKLHRLDELVNFNSDWLYFY